MADTGDASTSAGAAANTATVAATVAGDEVKPYKIHVSSKYLELTKQKLELTRLPHEGSVPKSEDWWEPKPQVEPIIDYWLEKHSWREQEEALNALPQFRTAISIPAQETPLRIHFIHIRSPFANAIPLLLIPPFPLTNLSFGHLVKLFTEPEDAAEQQPFHLVIPALPGLGFSDPLPNNTPVISTVAEMLNTLMLRLSYPHYLATNSGPASSSPAEIDWKLINYLANHYASSCLGAHLISPPLVSPKLNEAPLEWAKWSIANFFHAGILGYSDDDFSALERGQKGGAPSTAAAGGSSSPPSSSVLKRKQKRFSTPGEFGLNKFGLREPNTLAYALCDSPTGLLVFVLKGLRTLGPRVNFTPEQIVTLTELAWLPGPEYAMRLWAHCATHDDLPTAESQRKPAPKPKVAITVFLGDENGEQAAENAPANGDIPLVPLPASQEAERYVCPAWAKPHYDVLFARRASGKPGLLAWERPEIIAEGIRGLTKELLKTEKRLTPAIAEIATAPLEQVIISDETVVQDEAQGGDPGPSSPKPEDIKKPTVMFTEPIKEEPEAEHAAQAESSGTNLPKVIVEPSAKGKEPETFLAQPQKGNLPKTPSPAPSPAAEETAKGKGKDTPSDSLSPPRDPFAEGESPDTLVVNTPPLDRSSPAIDGVATSPPPATTDTETNTHHP